MSLDEIDAEEVCLRIADNADTLVAFWKFCAIGERDVDDMFLGRFDDRLVLGPDGEDASPGAVFLLFADVYWHYVWGFTIACPRNEG